MLIAAVASVARVWGYLDFVIVIHSNFDFLSYFEWFD